MTNSIYRFNDSKGRKIVRLPRAANFTRQRRTSIRAFRSTRQKYFAQRDKDRQWLITWIELTGGDDEGEQQANDRNEKDTRPAHASAMKMRQVAAGNHFVTFITRRRREQTKSEVAR